MRVLPPDPLLLGRRRLISAKLFIVLVIAAFAVGGCAKFPATGGGQNTHVIFTLTVPTGAHIRNGLDPQEPTPYVYMVAINPSTELFPAVQGPIPVITAPWGNGMVAGNATHFVRYWLGQQPYAYTIYEFPTSDMLTPIAKGAPINTLDPGANGQTIQFEIDLSQISTNPQALQSLQVNFLTMNRIPTGNDTGSKQWDALGDGRDPGSINDYIRIPLTSSRIYTNADFQDLEVSGDTVDPNLDIVNWSVEVRRP